MITTKSKFIVLRLYLFLFTVNVSLAQSSDNCVDKIINLTSQARELNRSYEKDAAVELYKTIFKNFRNDTIYCIPDSLKVYAFMWGSQAHAPNSKERSDLLLKAHEVFMKSSQEISANIEVRLHSMLGTYSQRDTHGHDLEKRKEYFDHAFEVAAKNNIDPTILFHLRLNVCDGYYNKIHPKPFKEIRAQLSVAKELFDAMPNVSNKMKYKLYSNLSNATIASDSEHLMLYYYDQIFDAIKNDVHVTTTFRIGMFGYLASSRAYNMREYDRAWQFIEDSDYCLRQRGLYNINSVYINGVKSRLLMTESRYEEAVALLDSTYHIYLKNNEPSGHILSEIFETRFELLYDMGEYQKAIETGHKAMDYANDFKRELIGKKTGFFDEFEHQLGQAYLANHQYKEAVHYLSKAVDLLTLDSNTINFVEAKINLTQALLLSGRHQEAILKMPDFPSLEKKVYGRPIEKYNASVQYVELLLSLNEVRNDSSYLSMAAEYLESFSVSNIAQLLLAEEMSNPSVFDDLTGFCEIILSHNLLSKRLSNDKKYEFIDNIRGFELHVESLLNSFTSIKEKDEKSNLLDQRRSLKKDIFQLNQMYSNAENKTIKDSIYPRLRDVERALTKFEKDHLGEIGKSFEIIPNQRGLSDLQDRMSDESIIFQYLKGEQNLFAIAILSDAFYFKSLPLEYIEKTVEQYVNDLTDLTVSQDILSQQGSRLYQLLLGDIAPGSEEKSKMIVIPDGFLHKLPFETLVGPSNKYLVNDCSIQYHLSSQLWSKNNWKSKRYKNTLVAFAPDYDYTLNAENILRAKPKNVGQIGYPNLPGALNEAQEICKIWDGKLLSGQQVTIENFKAEGEESRIIHLAMHATFDEENVHESALIFGSGQKDLTFAELSSICFGTELVTLSACNTGVGEIQSGYGVKSLARGFLSSGVPSIVMSLWEVPDKSTSQIMTDFYEELKIGRPKDVALQNAKKNYLLNCANPQLKHPLYWAGFVSFGYEAPITSSNKQWLIWLLPFLTFIFIGLLFIRKK